jgi:hypothetical protein
VELSDGDVTVRSWHASDLDELVAAVNDPEIGRWMLTREGVLRAWIEQNGAGRDHVLYSLLQDDR